MQRKLECPECRNLGCIVAWARMILRCESLGTNLVFLARVGFYEWHRRGCRFLSGVCCEGLVNAKPANVRKVAHLGDVVMLKSIWASNSRVERLKDKPRLRMCSHKYFVMIFAVHSGERKQPRFSQIDL